MRGWQSLVLGTLERGEGVAVTSIRQSGERRVGGSHQHWAFWRGAREWQSLALGSLDRGVRVAITSIGHSGERRESGSH